MDRQTVIKKIEAFTRTQKILIFVISFVLIIIVYYFLFFSPKYSQIKNLKTQIPQLDKKISNLRIKVSKLPALKDKTRALKRELIYAKTLLPETSHEMEDLLSEIEKLGNEVEVEFLLFSPGEEYRKKFYAIQIINLRLQGSFHNLMRLFSRLSHLNRLVTLENIQLHSQNKQENKTVTLLANCKIAVYRAISSEEKTDKHKK